MPRQVCGSWREPPSTSGWGESVPFFFCDGARRPAKGGSDVVAKPAPCWQCPEEQHKLSTAGPTGIYTPDLSDTQAWGPTQIGVSGQGDGKSGALARMRDRDAISSLPNFPGWGTFWSNLPEPSHGKRHQGGCGERVEREGSSRILPWLSYSKAPSVPLGQPGEASPATMA